MLETADPSCQMHGHKVQGQLVKSLKRFRQPRLLQHPWVRHNAAALQEHTFCAGSCRPCDLGQVYKAKLRDGPEVAVKVQPLPDRNTIDLPAEPPVTLFDRRMSSSWNEATWHGGGCRPCRQPSLVLWSRTILKKHRRVACMASDRENETEDLYLLKLGAGPLRRTACFSWLCIYSGLE